MHLGLAGEDDCCLFVPVLQIPSVTLARLYQVSPRQIRRWRERGLEPEAPKILAASLASQNRPGAVLDRLVRPGELEAIEEQIGEAKRHLPTIYAKHH